MFVTSSAFAARWRVGLLLLASLLITFSVLIFYGFISSPIKHHHVRQVKVWLKEKVRLDDLESCDCVWRIGCPKFRWQVNFTSPKYRCGYEELNEDLVSECLENRYHYHGRELKLRIAGHVREAFLVDYLRHRLGAEPVRQTCQLTWSEPTAKNFSDEKNIKYNQVAPQDDRRGTCEMEYKAKYMTLEYKLVRLLGEGTLQYVQGLKTECEESDCQGDILIISGGVAELLNSTLMDSFKGVRRFQKQYKRLLPILIDLAVTHKMEVVWKIHEPVTDELIPNGSMVRNDLLQEYNALIMEQTMRTPVRVWTSHMIMKLHHIEECATFTDDSIVNSDPWRCEEEWVGGDRVHGEYFDTIFNKVCDKQISMPENPCCSG